MARTPVKTAQPTHTTAQKLSSIVKSARDIMRKDKGLSGDLDRLPMLTWIMFLKFLDDVERIREQEALMAGERFRPAMSPLPVARLGRVAGGQPPPALFATAGPSGAAASPPKLTALTGDDLIALVNDDEAMRPDGVRGPGLFAYLRGLQGRTAATAAT